MQAFDSVTAEVDINGLGTQGDGVGRLDDGRVVFVPRALPGDRVRIRLGEIRKKIQYGELIELLEASEERVQSRCRIDACGGCTLKELSMFSQAKRKRERLVQCFARIAHLDVDPVTTDCRGAGDGWRYRHRARLHAQWDDQEGWMLGYHERRSHRLVSFEHCPVLWTELERVLERVRAGMAQLPMECELRDVDVAYSRRDERAVAKILIEGPVEAARESTEWFFVSQLAGVHVVGRDGQWQFGNLELRYDHRRNEEYDLFFEAGLFTQAYPELNDVLVDEVMRHVQPHKHPRVLEVHAGIGNFTVPLVRHGAEVHAVELNKRAAIVNGRNLRAAGLTARVSAASDADAAAWLENEDVLLMDPPRTGAWPVCEALSRVGGGPNKVIYVSCDPATLARDGKALIDGGFELQHVEPLDMFPQTPHVEAIAVFERDT